MVEERAPRTAVVNAMTVDVEDYFHVSNFAGIVTPDSWAARESRVERNTERLLQIFSEASVTATFFVLGWVAERFPQLVRRIADQGHEIASHGYAHQLIFDQSPEEFRNDVRQAKLLLENACGVEVRGYRAPSFSITKRSLWAMDILASEGYRYDSSVYPIHHDRYGIPDAPRHAYLTQGPSGPLLEVPGSTVQVGGMNLPIGGGAYFRLLPYRWTRWGIARVNAVEQRPTVFYLHPWEIDPDQPRLPVRALARFRHYHNLHRTDARLRTLLTDFRFGSMRQLIANLPSMAEEPRAPAVARTAEG